MGHLYASWAPEKLWQRYSISSCIMSGLFCKPVKLLVGQSCDSWATAGESPHRFKKDDLIKQDCLEQYSLRGSRYLSYTPAAQKNKELLEFEK